ncbi:hypothetical protein [Bacillus sp. MRMR6]|uniref:hypothetical protein n=1 Tax=Bacillus sp. MRMR6 TaxID=1928617 RepID=UPI0009521010|nr:hypothetical protein [Bacillus sp. MRMR6]OLS34731.1 hypothetical protein BTR25_21330 [Bacillus sp. MRMR6]
MEKTLHLILAEQKRQGDLLHQLINAVAVTNVKVADLDGKVTELNVKITETNEKVTEMDGKITEMDGKITEMDGKITEMDGKITEMDGKITELNGKVAIIGTKLDSVFEEVKDIKATMATKHDLEYYDQMISEHSREIYKLKNH